MDGLKTVEEYNAEVAEMRERMSRTGIRCPACKERELRWGHDMQITFPPQRAVRCECGWQGKVSA